MMEPLLIAVAIAAVVAILGIAAAFGYRAEKRRTEQLGQLADAMGFDFEAVADGSLVAAMDGLPLFGKGHSKKARNVLYKRVRGSDVVFLDYQYTIGSGKNRRTVKQTAAVFSQHARSDLPSFEMRPEGFFHKIGTYFGYQDIDFETHEKFSRDYLLRGPDEAAIRAAFTPHVLDFFESEHVRWCVEAGSNRIAIYRDRRLSPSETQQFLSDATRVFLVFVPNPSGGTT
jgi:hypothetical protein